MSSWTLETYETVHKTYPDWRITAEYRWDKGGGYSTFVGVFDEKGCHILTIFKGQYGTKEGARRAYRRQIKKLEQGDY